MPADFNGALYGEDYNFVYRDPYEAIVRFDDPVDTKVFGSRLALSDNGNCKIRFQSSGQFLSELLSLGINFCIIHPVWLKERLLARLKSVFSANADYEKAQKLYSREKRCD